ncbi:mRNA 3'-end-processing protein YTH1 [Verticillium alfalfae VaMs.102]|uniref:mRNA 3'-end-processing protein n=1 Tax=Verticillium alfalfae (strain VaMs.102 / ATCC MYA-4576 / FGSC 10136) TaxID=526221 RepID=C9SQF1_VERA1|nr:mRNA 3'-end-processing protein YTH1 [Verticillium alfalfae VaMs.102]EEY21076.1 mRNA 3'-end-processing protein YTH1 [Verticillium alfalfae VaMs.102]
MAAMTAHPSLAPSRAAPDLASHTEPAATFDFTPFLRATHQHALAADSAPGGQPAHTHAGRGPSLVCKHWLRGLCKKGAHCEFLHGVQPSARCPSATFSRERLLLQREECFYVHIDPQSSCRPAPTTTWASAPSAPPAPRSTSAAGCACSTSPASAPRAQLPRRPPPRGGKKEPRAGRSSKGRGPNARRGELQASGRRFEEEGRRPPLNRQKG